MNITYTKHLITVYPKTTADQKNIAFKFNRQDMNKIELNQKLC